MSLTPTSFHVLVLDPPPARLARLTEALASKGHRLSSCDSAERAFALLQEPSAASPDLLLVRPFGAPRAGLDLLVRIRSASRLPVVLLGGTTDGQGERVAALELGADEYLVPSMPLPEMVARIQAVLRRAIWATTPPAMPRGALASLADPGPAPPIEGGWCLLPHRRSLVGADGADIVPLTGAEFELLRLLTAARGEPVDREAISRAVFRRPWRVEDRAVDGLVKRVRRKMRSEGIATVRGVGYALRFSAPPAVADTSEMPAKVEICVTDTTRWSICQQPAVVK
jgi:DNA-binding response OmpR family regulator